VSRSPFVAAGQEEPSMQPRTAPRGLIALGRRVLGTRQVNHLVRFAPVLDLVRAAGSGGTVLDVGSGSLGIGTMLPSDWRVTAVDADFEDYGAARGRPQTGSSRVLGDVRALPFEDHSFDVVVAVDLLEHVPPEGREQAIREICRVARTRAVIACPADEDALTADRELAAGLRDRGQPVPGWLEEHLEHGFPHRARILATAEPFGAARVQGNENIAAHKRLVTAELSLIPALLTRLAAIPLAHLLTSRRRGARRLAAGILHAIRGRDRPPTYRAVVAVDITAGASRQSGFHSSE